jgi:hypothetical protein
MKKAWMAVLAVLAAGSLAWGQDAPGRGERDAVRAAFAAAKAGLAEAPLDAGTPVAVLPVKGDADGWMAGLAVDALTGAGKTCVVGKDEPMLQTIIDEIEWDERSSDVLDPETISRFGRLKSAKALMTARVDTSSREGRRWRAEVTLRLVEIETKQYVWSGTFDNTDPGTGTVAPPDAVQETTSPLNIGVEATAEEGAEEEAELLGTYVRGRLADMGLRVDSGKDDDLTLKLTTSCELHDRTLDWWLFKGDATVALNAKGGAARLLGEASFAAQGARGRGEAQAHRNLADDMEAQVWGWLKRTLDPDAFPFSAVELAFQLADSVETSADYRAIDSIQKALAGLEGVRRATLSSQDNRTGRLAFRVVYDKELLPTGVWNALMAAHPEIVDEWLR